MDPHRLAELIVAAVERNAHHERELFIAVAVLLVCLLVAGVELAILPVRR